MANNETIADIVEEMRNRAEAARQYDDGIVMLLNTLADRIETVYKRETVEVSTRAATFAINKTNEEWRQKLGNAAKLREAVVKIIDYLEPIRKWTMPTQENGTELTTLFAAVDTVYQIANAALAAPARNCDVPFRVEGTTWNIADKAWRVFKQTHPDAYFDTPNLVRCIEWLFAHAESEEGAK